MKKLLLAAPLILAIATVAASQPGPVPNPWVVSGPTISYSQGGVLVPSGVSGGTKGVGTINATGLYAAGVSVRSASILTSGTIDPARLPASSASALGGVESLTCASGQWFSVLNTSGIFGCSAVTIGSLPAIADGTVLGNSSGSTASPSALSILPSAVQGNITTLGTIVSGTWNGTVVTVPYGGTGVSSLASNGILYGGGTGAISALAVNATATKKYLQQLSSGTPSWQQIALADLSDASTVMTLTGTQIGTNKTFVDPIITTTAAGPNGNLYFYDGNVSISRSSTTLVLYGQFGTSVTSGTSGDVNISPGSGRIINLNKATTLTSGVGLNFAGSSSGTISLLPQAAAGTYNWNWPITAGTSGYVLASAGGGSSPMTWTQLATVATSGSASDLGAGTLPSGRISGSYTGLTGTGTLTAGATGSGFTVAVGTSTITGVLPAANGGAGTISGALKGNGSGTVSQAACADLSNGASGCSTAAAISATGTWTPVLKLGATTATISVSGANYTTFSSGLTVAVARIDVTNKNSGTGAIIVTGLPTFNGQAYQGCSINYYGNFVGITGNVFAVEAGNGSTEVDLNMATSTGNTALLDTNLGANAGFGITCTYYH